MIKVLRIVGFLMMALGALILVSWAIEPLRQLWPLVLALPMPVKIGLVVAAFGLLILMGSLIWERGESRKSEGDLTDDDY